MCITSTYICRALKLNDIEIHRVTYEQQRAAPGRYRKNGRQIVDRSTTVLAVFAESVMAAAIPGKPTAVFA